MPERRHSCHQSGVCACLKEISHKLHCAAFRRDYEWGSCSTSRVISDASRVTRDGRVVDHVVEVEVCRCLHESHHDWQEAQATGVRKGVGEITVAHLAVGQFDFDLGKPDQAMQQSHLVIVLYESYHI